MDIDSFLRALAENAALARLALASLELAVLSLAVAGAIRLLRIRSMRAQSLLWLVVLAKPIVGLAVGAPAPLFRFAGPQEKFALASGPGLRSNLGTFDEMPFDIEGLGASSFGVAPSADQIGASETTAFNMTAPVRSSASPTQNSWTFYATVAWLAGVAVFSVLAVIDIRRLRMLVRGAGDPDETLVRRYEQIVSDMGIRRTPRMVVADDLDSPALVGLIRPTVVMPRWLAEEAMTARMDWMLRHELTHWKYRDSLGLVVRRLAEILFYFHPAVWWAGRKWESAMERACDRALLTGESDACLYVEHLFGVLEKQRARRRLALSAGLFATRSQIGRRIEALLGNPLRSPARLSVLAAIAVGAAALICLSVGIGFENPATASEEPLENAAKQQLRQEKETQPTTQEPAGETVISNPFVQPAKEPNREKRSGQETVYSNPFSNAPKGKPGDGGLRLHNPSLSSWPDTIEDYNNSIEEIEDFNKRWRQKQQLELGSMAVEAWYVNHHSLPDGLLELRPYVVEPPEDLFDPGQPLHYRLDTSIEDGTRVALIYSVGPNGRDDGGRDINPVVGPFDDICDDIALAVRLEDLRARYPEGLAPTDFPDDKLLQALVAMKARGGRDNALLHYQFPGHLMPSLDNSAFETLHSTLQHGWSKESEILVPVFAAARPTLDEIRKGAALDYAKYPDAKDLPSHEVSQVDGSLLPTVSLRLLCAEAVYLAHLGRSEEALDNCLTALTMGRDFSAPGGGLYCQLTSIGCDNVALRGIHALASNGNLSPELLKRATARMDEIARTQGNVAEGLRVEASGHAVLWNKIRRREPENLKPWEEMISQSGDTRLTLDDVVRSIDQVERQWELVIKMFETPYGDPEFLALRQEIDREKKGIPPIARSLAPEFMEARIRELSMQARFGESKIACGLALYRAQHGRYPAALADLAPECLNEVPSDPFSGKPFAYQAGPGGTSYTLHSVGPDRANDTTGLLYDPTNGAISAGNVALRN
jgi:beta-lactamase regulating signal transducer with metallopeptidase domain